jgi:hypothetical protein
MTKLSILIPSNRPEQLEQYIESLKSLAKDMSRIELVTLVDDKVPNYVAYHHDRIEVHQNPVEPLSIAHMQFECYKVCSGDWIMLSNDDCIMQTQDWDEIIFQAASMVPDDIALFYPNDGMFGQKLACFPIISRKVIDALELFPMPYHRYKVDDTIFDLFPEHRRMYLGSVVQIHLNNQGTEGYQLEDGRIYPIDKAVATIDNQLWAMHSNTRIRYKHKIAQMLGMIPQITGVKVMVAIPTAEMARKANFYDFLNILEKPEGSMQISSHAQSPAKGRNMMIEQALIQGCTHIFFVDDDIILNPATLKNLLKHDVDIVTGVYCSRSFPHHPYLFHIAHEDGSCDGMIPGDEQSGLVEIVNAPLGCVLIKMEVFKKLESPWITLGELKKDEWCDDFSFFNRVRKAGFKIHADLDVCVGHQASVTVFYKKIDGRWCVSYDTGGTNEVSFPAMKI